MVHWAREYIALGFLGGFFWSVLLWNAVLMRYSMRHRLMRFFIILICWVCIILIWMRGLSVECWYPAYIP
jgi:hypothetical protein